MRDINTTIRVYKFEELSSKAQKSAKKRYSGANNWWKCIVKGVEQVDLDRYEFTVNGFIY